jgi:hypothetical protein
MGSHFPRNALTLTVSKFKLSKIANTWIPKLKITWWGGLKREAGAAGFRAATRFA